MTPEQLCDYLNHLTQIDRDALANLIEQRVECNEDLADHPHVVCQTNDKTGTVSVGLLGILNGMLEGPRICAVYDDETGQLQRFRPWIMPTMQAPQPASD
jgi:hypothetical protein